ncbi:exported hypothetical protein [Streptomyces misionensis JCM 4497]
MMPKRPRPSRVSSVSTPLSRSTVLTRDSTRARPPGAADLSFMVATLPPVREHGVTVTGYPPLRVTEGGRHGSRQARCGGPGLSRSRRAGPLLRRGARRHGGARGRRLGGTVGARRADAGLPAGRRAHPAAVALRGAVAAVPPGPGRAGPGRGGGGGPQAGGQAPGHRRPLPLLPGVRRSGGAPVLSLRLLNRPPGGEHGVRRPFPQHRARLPRPACPGRLLRGGGRGHPAGGVRRLGGPADPGRPPAGLPARPGPHAAAVAPRRPQRPAAAPGLRRRQHLGGDRRRPREGARARRPAAGPGGPGEEGLPGVRRPGRASVLPVPDRARVAAARG